jgi:ABC-type proline/glycine betaine transport system permease subunit
MVRGCFQVRLVPCVTFLENGKVSATIAQRMHATC